MSNDTKLYTHANHKALLQYNNLPPTVGSKPTSNKNQNYYCRAMQYTINKHLSLTTDKSGAQMLTVSLSARLFSIMFFVYCFLLFIVNLSFGSYPENLSHNFKFLLQA